MFVTSRRSPPASKKALWRPARKARRTHLGKVQEEGGLGLINVQYKALSLIIRSFLEKALLPSFYHNEYHVALYKWYVEDRRDLVQPAQPPYYDDSFFDTIRQVRNDGLLNLKTMSSGTWYRVLVELSPRTPSWSGAEFGYSQ